MHGTCARFGYLPLLFLLALLTLVVSTASSIVPVNGVEVAKTDTNFLTSSLDSDSRDIYSNDISSDGW